MGKVKVSLMVSVPVANWEARMGAVDRSLCLHLVEGGLEGKIEILQEIADTEACFELEANSLHRLGNVVVSI